jgi:hydroxymethylbilane synthase
MIQTNAVVNRLRQHWPDLEITIEHIHTRGDSITDVPLTQIGGDGVFVTEIERALHEKRIDLAVHSLKDLPTVQPVGLHVVAIGPREDVRDVLVWSNAAWHETRPLTARDPQGEPVPGKTGWGAMQWSDTAGGSRRESEGEATPLRIGTCSLRRTAQVSILYPGAQILSLRGNVDTRLRKLQAGDYDGIVLAAAGLHRLGMQGSLAGRITYLPVEAMTPAPGQGALALEMRDEPGMRALLEPLGDPVVQATTSAERMFMRRLGAGCYLPVAAYGEIANGVLRLLGLVISLDGGHQVRVSQSMPWTTRTGIEHAGQLGLQLAERALEQGAAKIIAALDVSRVQERQRV